VKVTSEKKESRNKSCTFTTYRRRRVLVTGHTGFKGGWLCSWLLELGAQVSGLALEPESSPSLFEAAKLDDRMTSYICDVRDQVVVQDILAETRPEIVFHLAAQPLVRRSYGDPLGTFATNIMGTAHLLDAARTCPSVRAVVVVTTDKVYDNREWAWPYREIDPLGGLDPYSASKAAAELVAATYQKNLCRGTIAIATARGGNVIGGGDWSEDRIVPDIVRAIIADVPIALRNPQAVRPWQHVLELCEAYLELGARLLTGGPDFAQAFNFGPYNSERLTVKELTDSILKIWHRPRHRYKIEPSPLHEAQVLRLDIAKACSLMSWRPRLGVHDALIWTVRWYKDYYQNPANAAVTTRNQIQSFAKLMELPRCE
jgi:CDP-glucose 4,6-dehydratase